MSRKSKEYSTDNELEELVNESSEENVTFDTAVMMWIVWIENLCRIIYNENATRAGDKTIKRRLYRQQLARTLVVPRAKERLNTPFLSRLLSFAPGSVVGVGRTRVVETGDDLERCGVCPLGSDRKTRHRCHELSPSMPSPLPRCVCSLCTVDGVHLQRKNCQKIDCCKLVIFVSQKNVSCLYLSSTARREVGRL